MAVFLYERCTLAKRPHFIAGWLNIVSNDHVKNEIQGLHVCPYFTKKNLSSKLIMEECCTKPAFTRVTRISFFCLLLFCFDFCCYPWHCFPLGSR